jgi:hypothetical protein
MCLVFGVVYQDFLKKFPKMSHELEEKSGNFYIFSQDAEEFFEKFPDASLQYKGHTLYNACQVENISSLKSDGNFPVNPSQSSIRNFPGWDPDEFRDLTFDGLI